MPWLAQNWHWVWALVCLAALTALVVHWRRRPEGRAARAFFYLFPFADPTGRAAPQVTLRAIAFFVLGLLILLLAAILVPGFVHAAA
jgi:hypothetical protein